jgi:hypothetical protein
VTLARLISPAARSGLFVIVGAALILGPPALALGTAAIVTGVVLGSVCVSLALAGTEPEGRGTIPLSAQAVYDRGLAVGLVLVGLVFGVAGDLGALALFALAGLGGLVVTSLTRYSGHSTRTS